MANQWHLFKNLQLLLFAGAIGSGTGILLAATIIYLYLQSELDDISTLFF